MKIFCKNSLRIGVLGIALTTCAGAPAHAQHMMMAKPDMAATEKLKTELGNNFDRLFMLHVAMGNLAEVKTGQMVLKKSKNPAVRMVAEVTMKGHGAAQKDLSMHFRAMNLPVPTMPDPAHVALHEKLSKLSGPAFDRMYMAQQVGDHEATITLFQHEIMAGKNEKVKAFAKNKLPDILMHTALIYDTATKVKAPGTDLRPSPILQAAMTANKNMKH